MVIETKSATQAVSYEKLPVSVFKDAKEGSVFVANAIAALIRSKQVQGEHAVLGLATGSTPKKVYQELVRMHREEGLSFSNVICFNLDEYYPLEPASPNSYLSFMKKELFDHIDIVPGNFHLPPSNIPQELVKAACDTYERMIQKAGGIDIQILGVGRNGHIGFNEPGSHVNSVTRLMTLDATTRYDAARDFGGFNNVPKKAITMGVSTILKAGKIFLMAWGEGKAEIIRQLAEGPLTEFVPGSYLQGHQDATLIIDEQASSALTRYKAPWLVEDVLWNQQMVKKAVLHLALSLNKPILKLTNNDYNQNGLSELLALYGKAYDINLEVFNWMKRTITGWPGGKPHADDSERPERALPAVKRVILFSPHPDDDIISMGGTFQRLVDQGHEVHVAYQTSGNIAVADDEALRFIEFVRDFNQQFGIDGDQTRNIFEKAEAFLKGKQHGEKDIDELRFVKGLIRRGEARNTCRFVGVPPHRIHFLDLPFYETGLVQKNPLGEEDYRIVQELIAQVKPHQVFAAGDLADPHGTHKVCLDAIFEALARLKSEPYMEDCWLWLYKGAWAEWDIDLIEMAVPMSPEQLLSKRYGIFKHQSQKDGVVFQGKDSREFWQRAEDRNRGTADIYNRLGLSEYEAMEAFVRWQY